MQTFNSLTAFEDYVDSRHLSVTAVSRSGFTMFVAYDKANRPVARIWVNQA